MTDIKEAFADGPFGSGEPMPHEREQSEKAESEQRDAVVAKSAPDESSKASGRDGRDDDTETDGEQEAERPQDLDKALKALDSERSIRREHRKELKRALAAQRDLEARYNQVVGQFTAAQQLAARGGQAQGTTQEKQPDKWDEWFTNGPDWVEQRIEQRIAQREQHQRQQFVAHVNARVQAQEQALVQTHADAGELTGHFRQIAASDPRLVQQFNTIAEQGGDAWGWAYEVAKQDREYSKFQSMDEFKQALREEWEAERSGGGGNQVASQQRRAPLTLAGRRGGGASVTPASRDTPITELAFPNF